MAPPTTPIWSRGTDKTAIIDTVKAKRVDEFMDKVRSLVDPATIDYIIVNHTEHDHSGSLAYLLEQSPNGDGGLHHRRQELSGQLLRNPFTCQAVKDGDTLDLGGRTLRFIIAPFLHWPDTMFTRLEEENILFTCDAFGAHYCECRAYLQR